MSNSAQITRGVATDVLLQTDRTQPTDSNPELRSKEWPPLIHDKKLLLADPVSSLSKFLHLCLYKGNNVFPVGAPLIRGVIGKF